MSAIKDSLAQQGLLPSGSQNRDITLNGEQYLFIDGDTVQNKETGKLLRVADLGARETFKTSAYGKVKEGEALGQEQTDAISAFASEGGYNHFEVLREGDRDVVNITNADGESLADRATASGIIEVTGYTTQDQAQQETFNSLARLVREHHGDSNEWDQVATAFETAIISEQGFIKDRAPDERSTGYDGYYGPIRGQTVRAHADTQFRSRDRDISNQALNPLSTAWDSGWKGVRENAWGAVELIGHEFGFEGLEDYAEGAKLGAQRDLSAQAEILQSYQDVDSLGDFAQYIGNMAALSLPYMAITLGGALAAPATGGLSLGAPASVYAGQVWNEMGDTDETDKSAVAAVTAGISMAVLDRLGISGILNTSLLSNAGRKEIIGKLVQKGATQEAAEAQLLKATRLEAAKFAGDAAAFAGRQVQAANIGRAFIASAAKGAATEGITEVGQETIGALAAHFGSGKSPEEWNWEDFNERITEAAIAGSVLGGGFSVPSTAVEAGKWYDVAVRQAPGDLTKQNDQARIADEIRKEKGYIPSNIENAQEAKRNHKIVRGKGVTERTTRHKKTKRSAKEVIYDIPGLWQGSTRFAIRDSIQELSESARKLAGLTDGSLYKIYNGFSFEAAKQVLAAKFKNNLKPVNNYLDAFGHKDSFRRPHERAEKTSAEIYEAFKLVDAAPRTKNGNLDWQSLKDQGYTDEKIQLFRQVDRDFQQYTAEIYKERSKHDPDIGFVENYAYKFRSVNKDTVEAKRDEHIRDLMKYFNVSREVATKTTDRMIRSADDYSSISTDGNFRPGSHKGRSLNLSETKEYADKYMNNDIFRNLGAMAKNTARYAAYNEYVGQNNEVVEQLINDVESDLLKAGWSPADAQAEADRMASKMTDYFDAESGNYNRPTSEFGKRLERWQKNIMLWTTIAGLPLATLSSLPELALTRRAINEEGIATLDKYANEMAHTIHNGAQDKNFDSEGRGWLNELGYFEWETGAAAHAGAIEQSNRNKVAVERFFKFIGLKQYTDYTRAVRASMAGDYILAKTETLYNSDPDNRTNEDLEAEDALRNLGLNVDRWLQIYDIGETRTKAYDSAVDPEVDIDKEYSDMMDVAVFNFINDAIVLPRASNRPLFYNDPRFALFTQFNGFISAFTAEILPKLYREAFQGTTPSMKYNTFAIMTTMIMMGFASQYLKDLLKYGEATPYLDTPKKVRRAINSSGLIGVFERPLDFVNPLYDERSDNTLDWAFDNFTGESPALNTVGRALGVAGSALTGEGHDAVRNTGKLLPLAGPFNGAHRKAADLIFGEQDG